MLRMLRIMISMAYLCLLRLLRTCSADAPHNDFNGLSIRAPQMGSCSAHAPQMLRRVFVGVWLIVFLRFLGVGGRV